MKQIRIVATSDLFSCDEIVPDTKAQNRLVEIKDGWVKAKEIASRSKDKELKKLALNDKLSVTTFA